MTTQCDRLGHAPKPKGALNRRTCVRCGMAVEQVAAAPSPPVEPTVPRDKELEEHLTRLAARASGFLDAEGEGDDRGLSAFSDYRALDGGVRTGMDKVQEAIEECADGRNYAVWGIQDVYEDYLRGQPEAVDTYVRHMRALQGFTIAWHAYHD